MNTMFEEPMVSKLEALRADAREKRRIVYDCENAQVIDGMRVICGKGHCLAPRNLKDGSMALDSVLEGRAASECKRCPAYRCIIDLMEEEQEEVVDTTQAVPKELYAVCR